MTNNMEIDQLVQNVQLVSAISRNNLLEVQTLLKAGANVNFINLYRNNGTPLHEAVISGNPEIIHFLLSNGANSEAMNGENKKPIDLCELLDDKKKLSVEAAFSSCAKAEVVRNSNRQRQPESATFSGTFTKRPGTAAVGQYYETKLLTMVLFRLLHDDRIESFSLGNNLDEVGAFDDIVLRTCVRGINRVYCLQAKHRKSTSSINFKDLVNPQITNGEFSLKKYVESFLRIRYQFSQTSNHAIFYGEYEQTKLELIIFTPSRINYPEEVCCSETAECDKFYTKKLAKTVQIHCTTALKDYFSNISKEWHRKAIADILAKQILSKEVTKTNFEEALEQLLRETVTWREILQLSCSQQTATGSVKAINQLGDKIAEILKESLLPPTNEHEHLANEFYSKLRFYSGQAHEDELEEIIKSNIREKGYKNEASMYFKSHEAVESWWKKDGLVPFQTKNCKIFKAAANDVKFEEHQTVSLNRIRSDYVSFRNETLNNPKCLNLHQKVKEDKILFLNIYSSTPELCCAKFIQYFNLYGNYFRFAIVDDAETINLLEFFSEENPDCLIIVYLPKVDSDIIEQYSGKIRKLIVVTSQCLNSDWRSIKDEIMCIRDFEIECQTKLLEHQVTFQGSEISLSVLMDKAPNNLINAETLQKLIANETIVISNASFSKDNEDEEYYIDRVLLDSQTNRLDLKSAVEKNAKLVIVAAEPGMGKSTLLTGLAKLIKTRNPSTWIVRINLLDYSGHFAELNKFVTALDVNKAMDLLLEATSHEKGNLESLENKLFRFYCECDQKEIYLLIDGFDEISPDYNEIVIQLLQLYIENFKNAKIWVTTRTGGAQKDLEERIKIRAFSMKSFTAEETNLFLWNYWKVGGEPNQQRKFDSFVKQLHLHLTQSIGLGEFELISVPLQIKMVAMIFRDRFQKYCSLTETELTFEKLDLVILYEKFIHLKFNVILMEDKQKADTTKPVMKREIGKMFQRKQVEHKQAAIFALFSEEDLEKLLTETERHELQDFLQEVHDSVEQTGIITRVVNGKPIFVHQTYAEFFAAMFIWEIYENLQDKQFETFIDNVLVNRLIRDERVQIAKFLQLKAQKNISCCKGDTYKAKVLLSKLLSVIPNSWKEFNRRAFSCLLGIVEYYTTHNCGCFTIPESLTCGRSDYIRNVLLLKAAENGYLCLVRMLTDAEPDRVDATFEWLAGWTALHFAASGGHQNLVEYLLDKSPNINSTTLENGQTALHMAAEKGHTRIARLLLENGADVNSSMTNIGITPLHLAAREGFVDVVKVLLSGNATIDSATTVDGQTALHIAVGNGHLKVVQILFESGADGNIGTRNSEGSTPLHIATKIGHLAIIRELLEQGSDVNVGTTNLGFTSLHWAARDNLLEIGSLLLAKGASIDSATKVVGNTPLHFATSRGHVEFVELLLDRGANISAATEDEGLTSLHLAAWKGLNRIVTMLLERGAAIDSTVTNDGGTPLLLATEEGHLETAKLLISNGANVKMATNDIGWTALHWAARYGFTEIFTLLLRNGANIDSGTTKDGTTALSVAIESDQPIMVAQILELGATTRKHNAGYTPLHDAAGSGSFEVVKLLLAKGFGVDSRRIEADPTPLLEACNQGHFNVVQLLLDSGADANLGIANIAYMPIHGAARSNSPEIIQFLVNRGANVNCTTTDGRTPLFEAACNLAVNAAKLLLKLGANPNLCDTEEGHTPLHKVAMKRLDSEDEGKNALEIVRVLLGHGASHLPIESGLNPLHAAASGGSPEIFMLLLEKDVDINSECQAIWKDVAITPLFQACACGNLEVVKLLLDRGANVHLGTSNIAYMPIHWAARNDCTEIVKLLAANEADINCITTNNWRTPLYEAATYGATNAVKLLLEMGANPNLGNIDGWTPLHRAAEKGHLVILRILLDHGASIHPIVSGYTALHAAVSGGSSEVLEFLLNDATIDIDIDGKWNDEGISPLLHACACRQLKIVQLLIDRGANLHLGTSNIAYTSMHWAARHDWTDIIQLLRNRGVNINCTTTDNGRTPLYEAISSGAKNAVKLLTELDANTELRSGSLSTVLDSSSNELLEYLFEKDVESNSKRKSAEVTIMTKACIEGNLKIVQMLLDRGTDVKLDTSEDGYKPIHWAARTDHTDIIKLLVKRGADINCTTTTDRRTPLYEASLYSATNAVKLLLEMGADAELGSITGGYKPLHRAAQKGFLEIVRTLLSHGVSVRPADFGYTALHSVATGGSGEVLEVLLEEVIDINSLWYGVTPLVQACVHGNWGIVKLLVNNGADVNIGLSTGYRPLYWAVRSGCMEIVELLLAKGADIDDTVSLIERTPLSEAETQGATKIIKLLKTMAIKNNSEKTRRQKLRNRQNGINYVKPL